MRRTALGLAVSLPFLLSVQVGSAQSVPLSAAAGASTVAGATGAGGPFDPPGTLYDNGTRDGSTSLASQDSSGTFTARTADDFVFTTACESDLVEISRIRVQMVQQDTAAQAFAVALFDDNGSDTAPTAGINPIEILAETSQTNLGPFNVGTSAFEASFDGNGLLLATNTRYWISGYGADADANPSGFNNFFAASDGAPDTTANGVIIAPGASVPNWTPVQAVIGAPPRAFSFAIDGSCATVDDDFLFADGFEQIPVMASR